MEASDEPGRSMQAMRLGDDPDQPALSQAEVAQPQPGPGDLLIRVRATGVTPTELRWYPTTHTSAGGKRTNAIPGHEFSGVVAAVGEGIDGWKVGDEVFGMNDWFADGATAQFCLARPSGVARKPAHLSHEAAATVPIAALTAWQGLLDRAKLRPGERVLIHGGAGSVGLFAVQLAHRQGAHVIATSSASHADLVRHLGADEVVDYQTTRFEQRVRDVDVVFDTVGGETRDRSWSLLTAQGRLITIASDAEADTDSRSKAAFFIVEPNAQQLAEVAALLDAGHLRAFVKAVLPLAQAPAAYGGRLPSAQQPGKIVLAVA
jgi:NADPH:quinone reductase-like Zn-dependent oxidoreductase